MHPPSVDSLARSLRRDPALAELSHSMLVEVARKAIATVPGDAAAEAQRLAAVAARSLLRQVINATGVLLHTNLGRAPMPLPTSHPTAVRASNLEFDLSSGKRGSRRDHAAALAARLCGAEAALVVNNCAGALVLVMAALAEGQGVLVSRGELVEIGGAFRIPDVLRAAGAELIEVGTTNRTRLSDYADGLRDATAKPHQAPVGMVLKVHQSNFKIVGFTEEVDVTQLATLGLPVVADIGSGLLDERLPWLADASGATPELAWLRNEPGARQSLQSGADLVLFSGDKLLGGPQAGIIAGSAALVERCARHPMARALRPGSLVLSALQDTLLRYARNEARSLPFWDMALRTVDSLAARASAIVGAVGDLRCTAVSMFSVPGGGTLPDRTIPSYGVCLNGAYGAALRRFALPIAARSEQGKTLCDLRTVDPVDDDVLIEAITLALSRSTTSSAARNGATQSGEEATQSINPKAAKAQSAGSPAAPHPVADTSNNGDAGTLVASDRLDEFDSAGSPHADAEYGRDTFGVPDGDLWLGDTDGAEP
jgi:L-seryl-tRNA(Ser) seleniumtransferase